MRNTHAIEHNQAIITLARRQNGLVTRAQLLDIGLGEAAIGWRCRTGRLFRVHLGVYGVGRPPLTPLERAAAAVLACGPDAALSNSCALTLWGLEKRWTAPWHVTTPAARRRPGIVVHRARGLTRTDIRVQLGIRVTSPARTMLDCAPELTERRLGRAVADARLQGLLHLGQLADVTGRFPYHPGRRALLATIEEAGAPTRSEFETAFLAFCRQFGLPRPQINAWVAGYEVDALFPAEGVIVELDSWTHHRERVSFESDRNRDADTLAAGLVTVRITWPRFTRTPRAEAKRLEAILAARRS
ncbi:MAG: type IV toxin-antitoxin system AbiEi family antitoxin domain-containing protein [Solirubrobacteraceae bacterium]